MRVRWVASCVPDRHDIVTWIATSRPSQFYQTESHQLQLKAESALNEKTFLLTHKQQATSTSDKHAVDFEALKNVRSLVHVLSGDADPA
jgi:hypothetical protein